MKPIILSLLMVFIIAPLNVFADDGAYNLHLHSEVIEQEGKGGQHLEIKELNTDTIQKVVIDSGKKTIQLSKGDYEIRTVKAPYGFEAVGEPIQFSVPFVTKEDGKTLADFTIELKLEEILKDVIVTKEDKSTNDRLSGAIFDIAQVNSEGRIVTLFEDLETDKNGQFRVDGVRYGTYEFIETVAPNGYARLTESVAFTVDENSEDIIKLTIYNEKVPVEVVPEVPTPETPAYERTGVSALNGLVILGIGLLGVLGAYGFKKSKEDKQ